MVIPYYIESVREGMSLAGVDLNFLLFSDKNMYGDFTSADGTRVYKDIHRKPIPKGFSERKGHFNIKTGLNDAEKSSLELPSEYDPIVLFTKGRTTEYMDSLSSYGLVKKEFAEYLRQTTPEEFGKVLTVVSFHEGSHRKYDIKKCIEIIRKNGLHSYVNPHTEEITIEHVPIFADEIRLAEKRPDLEPVINRLRDGNTDPPYSRAYELALKMV